MSHIRLYQVLDLVAQRTLGPILTNYNDAAAVRVFTEALNDARTSLSKAPQDYALVLLGEQDEETGSLFPLDGIPTVVLHGKTWAAIAKPDSGASPRTPAGADNGADQLSLTR